MILATIDTDTFEPEFDHVYLIDGLGVITDNAEGIHAPDVINDPDADVHVSTGWSVLTDHSGQYSYHGAVMHPSEQWGEWAIRDLASRADEGHVAFVIVEVRDENGDYPEGDPIGWAVAWKRVSA